MKKTCAVITVMLLILAPSVVSTSHDPEEKTPKEAFQDNPTPENFNKLPSPTAADLTRVSNPTLQNFERLPETEQRTYLQTNYRTDFAEAYVQKSSFDSAEDRELAEKYFTENRKNVNANREHFIRYSKKEGITIKLDGDIQGYSADGTLAGLNGQINIKKFKDKFNFRVDEEGEIRIIDKKRPGEEHRFVGDIEYSEGGTIRLADGGIDRFEIVNGDRLEFNADIHGIAEQVDGVTFSKPTAFSLAGDVREFALQTENAVIVSINTEQIITFRGKNIVLPTQDQLRSGGFVWDRGAIRFLRGSEFALREGAYFKIKKDTHFFRDSKDHSVIKESFIQTDVDDKAGIRRLVIAAKQDNNVNAELGPDHPYKFVLLGDNQGSITLKEGDAVVTASKGKVTVQGNIKPETFTLTESGYYASSEGYGKCETQCTTVVRELEVRIKARREKSLGQALTNLGDFSLTTADAVDDIVAFGPEAVPGLINALDSPDSLVRERAVIALGQLKDTRATEPLIKLLDDSEQGVRVEAIQALGRIADTKATDSLISKAQEAPELKGYVMRALGSIGGTKAEETVIAGLNDDDSFVREEAIKAVGNLRSERAVDDLKNLMRHESETTRLAAIRALGDIDTIKSITVLGAELGEKPSEEKELAILDALGQSKQTAAVAFLKTYAQVEGSFLAISRLEESPAEAADGMLADLVRNKDVDDSFRERAAEALVARGKADIVVEMLKNKEISGNMAFYVLKDAPLGVATINELLPYNKELSPEVRAQFEKRIPALEQVGAQVRLSDVNTVAQLPDDYFTKDTTQLLSELKDISPPGTERANKLGYESESIEDNAGRVSWDDAAKMHFIANQLKTNPDLRTQIGKIIAQDRADTTTEYGGLFFVEKGKLTVVPYEPASRGNDGRYSPSRQFERDASNALGYFHLHAGAENYGLFAGPSGHDGNFAGLAGIVITSIDKKTFNVDYFPNQAERTVIDLGNYEK